MPKLKSLFGGNQRKPEADKVDNVGKMEKMPAPRSSKSASSNRSPGVVARLMGLEMLPGEEIKSSNSSSRRNSNQVNRVESPRTRQAPPVQAQHKRVLLEKRVPDSNTLVDISVSVKQVNAVTGNRGTRKWKSFDEAFATENPADEFRFKQRRRQQHGSDELRARAAQLDSAECLQSIQLDELNRQLMAKHLQVLDELGEARKQLSESEWGTPRSRSKGLSDSTEFLDAVELLQANRQFFEKYFHGTGALTTSVLRKDDEPRSKMKVSNRIPQYLSGHSSPRPPPSRLMEQGSEFDRESVQGTNIVVLKPRKPGKPEKPEKPKPELPRKPQEKLESKDLAKLIAKKIKDSITKEVAKTFYSKLDAAVSPVQKASPGRSHNRDEQSKQATPQRSSGKKTPEQRLDGSKRGSQQLSKTRVLDQEAFTTDSSKNARVLKSQRTGATIQKKLLSDSKSRPLDRNRVLDSSPRRKTPSAPVSPRFSRVNSRAPKVSPGDPVEALKEAANRLDVDSGADHSAAEVPVDTTTPTKTEMNPKVIDLSDNSKSSPVSVLELIDDEEEDGFDDLIVKTIDVISSSESLQQEHPAVQQQQQEHPAIQQDQLQQQHQKPAIQQKHQQDQPVELTASSDTEEELIYLRKLVGASSQDGVFNRVLEPSLFEALEEEYSQQSSEEMFVEPVKAQVRAFSRWLMFDLVNELLSGEWSRGVDRVTRISSSTEQQALRELWSKVSDHFSLQRCGESHSIQSLTRFDLNTDEAWDGDNCGVPEICEQLEISLINNLIDEAMAEFLY